ncbi:MAG: serine/threonine protein kinase [Chloroflexota bacterium]|nr:serine/threonine protein kinase [Chloroflexota bacterium]
MSYESETTPRDKNLGRYHLVRRIGRGGMGEVWLAEDPSLHRQVAIKTLPVQDREDQQAALRFTREARSIAALHHLHILPVHDYGKQEQSGGQEIIYIVMPYIAGGSLAQRIAASGSNMIPQREAITYLAQAAEAIDFAHQHGIVHRDVKPENLLLRDDRWLFLADFGLAYSVQSGEQVTTHGVGFGTPDYMAPEQAQGHAEPASDIYSLAVIAYQLFTGRLPFHGETSYATVVQHMTMAPPAPRQFNPALSPVTEIVLLRGLAKAAGERPSSAQAFVSELQQTLVDAPFAPTLLPGEELVPTLAARPVRKTPQAYGLAVSVVSPGTRAGISGVDSR